ncbi:hypothetical protein [Thermococcus sp. M36]|uniref:hypothetical protein n=1 Tax=Thermococcus sp. M36 TaxID=1638261 RepID=UPI001F0F2687|nr:hypothetical protein [Thermococcus sp. M36]
MPIFILCILGLSTVSATTLYSWNGKLGPGDKILVNNLIISLDTDRNSGEIALIIKNSTNVIAILKNGQFIKVKDLTISFNAAGEYSIVSVTGREFFNVVIPTSGQPNNLEALKEENKKLEAQVQQLKDENTKLKQRVSELEKQLKNQPNTAELQTKLVNLTKENRELKAELKNLTDKYNALKAKADFLSQQNEEYRTMIQNLLKETAQGSEQDYIEQAKKERLIGSVIIKTLVVALVVVGLIGYGLYRKKRGWEYPL